MLLVNAAVFGGTLYMVRSYNRRRKKKKPLILDMMSLETVSNREKTQTLSFGKRRQQQLQEMASTRDEIEITQAEIKNNRNVAVSLSSLAFATVGSLAFPPLRLLSAGCLVYVSIPFFKDGYTSIVQKREVNIAVLDAIVAGMSIATGSFVAWSLACSLLYGGKKILTKTEDHSRKSLLDVFGLQSQSVWVQRDGVEVETLLEELQLGDIVVIHGGGTIPIDGTIVNGIATVDQRILTGESQPAEKDVGDPVFAATIVLTGTIYIKVEQAGQETAAAKIAEILNHTSDFKSSVQSRGEAYANRAALPTLTLASAALLTIGPVGAMAVLNACFAYYMRVLGPIGMLNFLNLSSQKGILIKDGRVLDLLAKVDTIVFDKTGTLTHEQPNVEQIHVVDSYTAYQVLAYAAAAEYKQSHPIARAILEEAKTQGLTIPKTDETDYKIGYGLTVIVENQVVQVGSVRFIETEGLAIPKQISELQVACHEQGHSLVVVAVDQTVVGAIELLPTVRPEAQEIIEQLRLQHGKSIYIISGDHQTPTQKLADELGIDNYFAETLPEHKADLITKLQEEGKFVCYVGDGINDSIALKSAPVSVSLRGAATIATDTAQVILMNGDLSQLVQLFSIASEFNTSMNRSLIATLIPGMITVSGAFFLHFGLIHSIILNELGFITGFSNTMFSMIKHRKSAHTNEMLEVSVAQDSIKAIEAPAIDYQLVQFGRNK